MTRKRGPATTPHPSRRRVRRTAAAMDARAALGAIEVRDARETVAAPVGSVERSERGARRIIGGPFLLLLLGLRSAVNAAAYLDPGRAKTHRSVGTSRGATVAPAGDQPTIQ